MSEVEGRNIMKLIKNEINIESKEIKLKQHGK